jgi:all-trans-retinol 13,14-reductase
VDTRWKHRGVEYGELKARLTERLKGELENAVPQVRGKIDYCELSTPLSTRSFTNHQNGEIYGLAHVPERFRLNCLGPRTTCARPLLDGRGRDHGWGYRRNDGRRAHGFGDPEA